MHSDSSGGLWPAATCVRQPASEDLYIFIDTSVLVCLPECRSRLSAPPALPSSSSPSSASLLPRSSVPPGPFRPRTHPAPASPPPGAGVTCATLRRLHRRPVGNLQCHWNSDTGIVASTIGGLPWDDPTSSDLGGGLRPVLVPPAGSWSGRTTTEEPGPVSVLCALVLGHGSGPG